ncbi:uncharacterized protein LOC142666146 [Rhinoderma darwinii]|uniref:uncharacterized protein LOC142666146 n=1 Tax=Rhinoderma darwinii TaxID=43563 RepID=UPI003F67DCAC
MRVHFLLLTAYAITTTDATSTSSTLNNTEQFNSHVSDAGSLSTPTIHYNSLGGGNAMHITCFSKSGPLPIRYQLTISDHILQEKNVTKSEPANFTIEMTPGTQGNLNCKAISQTGEKKSSKIVKLNIPVDIPVEEAKTDKKDDKDTGPEHLIPLQHILTSVTPEVLQWNTMVLNICGPVILSLLVIVLIITYLRSQKEEHMEA